MTLFPQENPFRSFYEMDILPSTSPQMVLLPVTCLPLFSISKDDVYWQGVKGKAFPLQA